MTQQEVGNERLADAIEQARPDADEVPHELPLHGAHGLRPPASTWRDMIVPAPPPPDPAPVYEPDTVMHEMHAPAASDSGNLNDCARLESSPRPCTPDTQEWQITWTPSSPISPDRRTRHLRASIPQPRSLLLVGVDAPGHLDRRLALHALRRQTQADRLHHQPTNRSPDPRPLEAAHPITGDRPGALTAADGSRLLDGPTRPGRGSAALNDGSGVGRGCRR